MGQTFDHEKVSFNLAKLRKNGKEFEIVVDPDLAIEYREKKPQDINEAIKSPEIFIDAKKGLLAPEHEFQQVFGTTNIDEIHKIILFHGEIQLSQEHREKLREQKRNKIIEIIHSISYDPKTNTVHPRQRIELAFKEAKIHVDEFKSAEQQIDNIIKLLRPIMPISIEQKEIEAIIPAEFGAKAYSNIKAMCNPEREDWLNDGSLFIIVKVPAGIANKLIDELNSITHGNVNIKVK